MTLALGGVAFVLLGVALLLEVRNAHLLRKLDHQYTEELRQTLQMLENLKKQ